MERPTARQFAWQWQERIDIRDRKTLDGDQSLFFNRLMDLGDPLEDFDAVNKKYVDDVFGDGEIIVDLTEHLAAYDHTNIHPSNIIDGDTVDVSGRDTGDVLTWNGAMWVPASIIYPADSGWIEVFETWTYASADAPTFTFTVVGDKSTKYYPGMRIKLTQTTVKYFIITKVAYSSPNTTITVYGGTNYTLANDTIESPCYSMLKAPTGFPLDPTKWTVLLTDSTDRHQSNPVKDTIYNPGSLSISIPIGIWNVSFQAILVCAASSGPYTDIYGGLSTSLVAFDNQALRGRGYLGGPTTGTSIGLLFRSTVLNIVSKTTYYVLYMTDLDNQSVIGFNNASDASLDVRAVCAYL